MKVFGRNNVAILATLFLLSYVKILKAIFTALSFTEVLRGSADNVSDQLLPYEVWTYDGNFEYLKGKHVPLFLVALVFLIFLFLPYTLLLIFGQCIRSLPIRRRCNIRSMAFVSIMDAYHALYINRHRYWTGLMLLTRCVLFLIFASNYRDSELLSNMYATTLVLVVILIFKSTLAMKVYRSVFTNILEIAFFSNLIILSTTVHLLRTNTSTDNKICTSISASISVSMLMLAGILTYHTYLKIHKTKYFLFLKSPVYMGWSRKWNRIRTQTT